jgi:hypothetical protein
MIAPTADSNEDLLTTAEVALLLRMTSGWVYAETRENRIPHLRLGRYVANEGPWGPYRTEAKKSRVISSCSLNRIESASASLTSNSIAGVRFASRFACASISSPSSVRTARAEVHRARTCC